MKLAVLLVVALALNFAYSYPKPGWGKPKPGPGLGLGGRPKPGLGGRPKPGPGLGLGGRPKPGAGPKPGPGPKPGAGWAGKGGFENIFGFMKNKKPAGMALIFLSSVEEAIESVDMGAPKMLKTRILGIVRSIKKYVSDNKDAEWDCPIDFMLDAVEQGVKNAGGEDRISQGILKLIGKINQALVDNAEKIEKNPIAKILTVMHTIKKSMPKQNLEKFSDKAEEFAKAVAKAVMSKMPKPAGGMPTGFKDNMDKFFENIPGKQNWNFDITPEDFEKYANLVYEEPEFTLSSDQPASGAYEVRDYSKAVWACSDEVSRIPATAMSNAFMRLFAYIEGNNAEGQKMDMTIPVLTKHFKGCPECEKKFTTCFYLPKEFHDSPPKPNSKLVFLYKSTGMTLLARKFEGLGFGGEWFREAKKLRADVAAAGQHSYNEDLFATAGFTDPFKPNQKPRSEVYLISSKSTS